MDEVVGEVDFFGGPGGGLRALVELPDLRVLDRKHAESIRIWARSGSSRTEGMVGRFGFSGR